MVYKKSYRKRPSYRKSGPSRRKRVRRTKRTYSRRGLRTGGLLNIERKYFDSWKEPTSLSVNWTNSILSPTNNTATAGTDAQCLFAPKQGNEAYGRIGTRVHVKSIYIDGEINRDIQATTDPTAQTRYNIALILDTQANGAIMLPAQVYDDVNVPKANPLRVLANTSRFRVLKTWSGVLADTVAGTTNTTGSAKIFTCKLNLNMDVNFINATGVGKIADIRDNAFYLCAMGSNATCQIRYKCRFRYTD